MPRPRATAFPSFWPFRGLRVEATAQSFPADPETGPFRMSAMGGWRTRRDGGQWLDRRQEGHEFRRAWGRDYRQPTIPRTEARSFFGSYATPSLKTNTVSSMSAMFWEGSPPKTMRSARLPGSIVPRS